MLPSANNALMLCLILVHAVRAVNVENCCAHCSLFGLPMQLNNMTLL